jgi:hypothetical protein
MTTLKFLFLGDIYGKPGCAMAEKWISQLVAKHAVQAVIVNTENSGNNGKGISPKIAQMFKDLGVFALTTGNHVWAQRDIYQYIGENNFLLRPLNFPSSCPGKGIFIGEVAGHTVAIINAQGRVFMREDLDCPFKAIDSALTYVQTKTKLIFIDFHAEATSEKAALAYYLDGRVSGFFGTHTHVQTADERILPKGTAFMSDLGFSGALNSALGAKSSVIIQKFLTQMPHKFEVETTGPFVMSGLFVTVDTQTGKALSVERLRIIDEQLSVAAE